MNRMHIQQQQHAAAGGSAGLTLIEMLVSLAIFAGVTIVITTSFITLLTLRQQAIDTRQITDDFRLTMDTMERDITGGTQITPICNAAGVCSGIDLLVAKRPDITPYQVQYRLNTNTKQIEKAIQRQDGGPCSTTLYDPECFLPVTSDDIVIDELQFSVTVPAISSVLVRPLVSIHIKGRINASTSEEVPLEYSTSFAPRASQDPSVIATPSDSQPPDIQIQDILPSGAGCYVVDLDHTDALGNPKTVAQAYADGDYNIPNTQNLNLETNCDWINVVFEANDTGISDGLAVLETYNVYNWFWWQPAAAAGVTGWNTNRYQKYTVPSGPGNPLVFTQSWTAVNVPLKRGYVAAAPVPQLVQQVIVRAQDNKGNQGYVRLYIRQTVAPSVAPTNNWPASGPTPTASIYCDQATGNFVTKIYLPFRYNSHRIHQLYLCETADYADPSHCDIVDANKLYASPVADELNAQDHCIARTWPGVRTLREYRCNAPDYWTGPWGWGIAPPLPYLVDAWLDNVTLSTSTTSPTYYRYGVTTLDELTRMESPMEIMQWTVGAAPGNSTYGWVDGTATSCSPIAGSQLYSVALQSNGIMTAPVQPSQTGVIRDSSATFISYTQDPASPNPAPPAVVLSMATTTAYDSSGLPGPTFIPKFNYVYATRNLNGSGSSMPLIVGVPDGTPPDTYTMVVEAAYTSNGLPAVASLTVPIVVTDSTGGES